MKRIYLYFKEKIEKEEEQVSTGYPTGTNLPLLGTRSFFYYLVSGTGYSEAFPCQLSMYADSGAADVCICHVLTLVHGSLGESA